jgi:RNA polymerase sigma-70 factor (ECF subfamily)
MNPITPSLLARAFDEHSARLVLYARQWLPQHAAEDIVQEIFVRLAAQPQSPDNLKAWLLVSVRNACFDALKSNQRRKSRDHSAGINRTEFFEPNPAAPLDAADLQSALATLPAQQREVIILRIWTAATFQEIAGITTLPLSTVYALYQSALETLRTKWESPCKT